MISDGFDPLLTTQASNKSRVIDSRILSRLATNDKYLTICHSCGVPPPRRPHVIPLPNALFVTAGMVYVLVAELRGILTNGWIRQSKGVVHLIDDGVLTRNPLVVRQGRSIFWPRWPRSRSDSAWGRFIPPHLRSDKIWIKVFAVQIISIVYLPRAL